MTNEEFITELYYMTTLEIELEKFRSKMRETSIVSKYKTFKPYKILKGCREENNRLFDSDGVFLAGNGLTDNLYYYMPFEYDEDKDCLYSKLYFKTDKPGKFIAVNCCQ